MSIWNLALVPVTQPFPGPNTTYPLHYNPGFGVVINNTQIQQPHHIPQHTDYPFYSNNAAPFVWAPAFHNGRPIGLARLLPDGVHLDHYVYRDPPVIPSHNQIAAPPVPVPSNARDVQSPPDLANTIPQHEANSSTTPSVSNGNAQASAAVRPSRSSWFGCFRRRDKRAKVKRE